MALDRELLAILACPACKAELNYREKDRVLVCVSCRRHYRVVDDIPNLLVDQAVIP